MAKLLLIVVVCALVYWIVKVYVRSVASKREASAEQPSEEDMVKCGHCGLHLPRSESVSAGDRHFCSREHQRLGGG